MTVGRGRIGFYVHHSGSGHRTRARVIARELTRRGWQVSLLGAGLLDSASGTTVSDPASSRSDADVSPQVARPTSRSPGGGALADAADVELVELASDDDLADPQDPTAGGHLHWVPLRSTGLRRRMATIAAWVEQARPAAFVVDVSVEVATLVRLLGVPVVTMAQPGHRDDPAHQLGYGLSTAIVAPWPAAVGIPTPEGAVHVGGISRYGGRRCPRHERTGRGVVMAGADGFDDPALPDVIAAAVPGIAWQIGDRHRWIDDPAAALAEADVMVCHAGQNAIADVAAWHVPAVVVPQRRPHDEQLVTAAALRAAGLARVVERPDVADWAGEVAAALNAPGRWDAWRVHRSAARAADAIEQVAR